MADLVQTVQKTEMVELDEAFANWTLPTFAMHQHLWTSEQQRWGTPL